MGCLSHCGFSAWKDHDDFSTGYLADPRSFCIQKTLQDAVHHGDMDHNLVFAGHNAYNFKRDPFLFQRIRADCEATRRPYPDGRLSGMMRAPDLPGLAVLRYRAADFEVVRPGRFVLCAVSGVEIPLSELAYWSAARQEAYRSAIEATKALLPHA